MSIALHRPIAAATFLAVLTGSAAALPLSPGGVVSGYWNYETYVAAAVAADDPAFFGTPGPTASGSATVIRDGLDPGSYEPIENLFVATGTIQTSVTLSGAGRTVFQYDFDVDPTNAGPSGLAFATVSGFAGYELDVVPVDQAPVDPVFGPLLFGPEISRSADGDTVRFDFAIDELFSEGLDGSIEPILIATDAPSYRGGAAGTVGLSIDTFGVIEESVSPGLLAPAPIPLPAGLPLLALGLGALGLAGRRRKG